jgi:cytochrome c-type biogenesis protein CcmH/NrfG
VVGPPPLIDEANRAPARWSRNRKETMMKTIRSGLLVMAITGLLLAAPLLARAAGGAPPPPALGQPDVTRELAHAQQLIDKQDWAGALTELKSAQRKDRKNADVYNLMGYSYRKSGQLDAAFDSYRSALRLDPKHRGAHEYIGEAYLMANQPDKAREHLAALKGICGESCEEYQDLSRAIAGWQPPAAGAVR